MNNKLLLNYNNNRFEQRHQKLLGLEANFKVVRQALSVVSDCLGVTLRAIFLSEDYPCEEAI